MKTHTMQWKKKDLEEIKKLASQYNVIAVASLDNFPAGLAQTIRKKLKGKAVIRVSKTRVLRKALEDTKFKGTELIPLVEKSIAIIFTNLDSFEIYGFLKRNKGSVAAKEGSIAPDDIVVPAGDTGLPPGPALSDLKAAGLNVRVQGSTIAVAQDKIVARKGEAISKAAANVLSKLDIKPIKVGLNVLGCYENGELFRPDVLDIDSEQVYNDIVTAVRNAINLSVETVYPTKETIELILVKAERQAKALEAALPGEAKAGEKPKEGSDEKEQAEAKKEESAKEEKPVESAGEKDGQGKKEPGQEKPAEDKPKEPVESAVEEKKDAAKEKIVPAKKAEKPAKKKGEAKK
ncbi:MAG: 50S ribosomal protein L10 [Candidatus Diapherotrites archaeon]|nr:50S ribosomal protein L10 [Candidatus Diapherotrites archaeon]